MKKRQGGYTPVVILAVLAGLIILASAASYYLLNSYRPEVSSSDSTLVIDQELEDTKIDSIDSDLNDLEQSASSL